MCRDGSARRAAARGPSRPLRPGRRGRARLLAPREHQMCHCHFRKRATLRLQKDLRTGSISRDIVNFPSELCMRRSGGFAEVACLG